MNEECTELYQILVADTHNHNPPSRLPLRPAIKQSIKEMINLGLKPMAIERQIVEQEEARGEPLTSKNYAKPRKISQMKYYMKRISLPSSDSIQNLVANKFVDTLKLKPDIEILMFTAESLAVLREYGNDNVFVDGTFAITELDMQLTTIMTTVEGVGIPVAWMLSTRKTQETYEAFFGRVKTYLID
jgi:hypothetical protein